MKFFRKLVTLRGLSVVFWDQACFINQLLVSLCKALADYTCYKDSSLIFSPDFYIKGKNFLSSQTFYVAIIIFYSLLATKKISGLEFVTFFSFL